MDTSRYVLFTAIIFSWLALLPIAEAQTLDGLTPAEESVCDSLVGATPGLYGLCVAYCEAHDADMISPDGDPGELNMPNRRILENYNKKKTETDPPMPCALPVDPIEPCACWTGVELEEMMPPIVNEDRWYENACYSSSSAAVLVNYETQEFGDYFVLDVYESEGCSVRKRGKFAHLGPDAGVANGLSAEETASCRAMLTDHARKYSTPGMVWDCFDP